MEAVAAAGSGQVSARPSQHAAVTVAVRPAAVPRLGGAGARHRRRRGRSDRVVRRRPCAAGRVARHHQRGHPATGGCVRPTPPHLFCRCLTDQLIATLGQIECAACRIAHVGDAVQGCQAVNPAGLRHPRRRRHRRRDGRGQSGDVGASRPRARQRQADIGGRQRPLVAYFNRLLGETLALEAEVAREVANGVHATITPEEHLRLTQVRSTNPSAEQAYFKGLHQLHQLGADNMRAAVDAFKRAIELDPNYAEAYAGLARAHITLGFMRATSQSEARVSALSAASRAAELDPQSSAAQEVLADLKFYYDWDWPGADACVPEGDRPEPQLGSGPLAVRALSHRPGPRRCRARGGRARGRLWTRFPPARDRRRRWCSTTCATTIGRSRRPRGRCSSIRAPRASTSSRPGSCRARGARRGDGRQRTRDCPGWTPGDGLARARDPAEGAGRQARRRSRRAPHPERRGRSGAQRIGPGQLAYIEAALGDRAAALRQLELAAAERDSDLLYLAVDPTSRFAAQRSSIPAPACTPRIADT